MRRDENDVVPDGSSFTRVGYPRALIWIKRDGRDERVQLLRRKFDLTIWRTRARSVKGNERLLQKKRPAISSLSIEDKKVVLYRATADRQGAFHLADTCAEPGF
jgi:hypothetical protein